MSKKTFLMSKLFSASTSKQFKRSFSESVQEAMEDGNSTFTDEDGNTIELNKIDDDTIIASDVENMEETKIESNPEDSNDLLMEKVESKSRRSVRKRNFNFSEPKECKDCTEELINEVKEESESEMEVTPESDGTFSISGKRFSRKEARIFTKLYSDMEPQPENIEGEVDWEKSAPEITVEQIEGTDGSHFSVRAKGLSKKAMNKFIKRFSDLDVNPQPEDIEANIDWEKSAPEATIEVIPGTDGEHFSLTAKNFSKRQWKKFMKAFSDEITETVEETITEEPVEETITSSRHRNFSEEEVEIEVKETEEPEVEVTEVKSNKFSINFRSFSKRDAKHLVRLFSEQDPGSLEVTENEDGTYSAELVGADQGVVDKVVEAFSDEEPIAADIVQENVGTVANPAVDVTGDMGVEDPELAGTVEATGIESKTFNMAPGYGQGRPVEYQGKKYICIQEWDTEAVIADGDGITNKKIVPRAELTFFSDADTVEVSEEVAEKVETIQDKIEELVETKDESLAEEVRTLTEELLNEVKGTEDEAVVKEMCNTFSEAVDAAVAQEGVVVESEIEDAPIIETPGVTMSKLLGMHDVEETPAPTENKSKIAIKKKSFPSPKVDPSDKSNSTSTFSNVRVNVGTNKGDTDGLTRCLFPEVF
jgi:hypothetical protein